MLEIVSCDNSVPKVRSRWAWMSRIVIPPGVGGDDHVRQAADAALALRHQPRVEGGVTVPRGGQIDVADLGLQPFRRGAVPGVPRPVTGPVMLLIAQMVGQL